MKILIASDIHGSAYYCAKLMDAYEREHAGKLILLGDILYHGPRNDLPLEYSPKATASLLNKKSGDIFSVRGNCDAEIDQAVLEFPMLAEYAILFVSGCTVCAVHGHELEAAPSGSVVLRGHTHVPGMERLGETIYMNPGSVSMPKQGSVHGYMTLDTDNGLFRWLDLSGECFREFSL